MSSNFCGLSFITKQAQAKTEEKKMIAKKLSFPNSLIMLYGTALMKIPVRRLSEIEILAMVLEGAPSKLNSRSEFE
jgi:soluble P-type ATPase